MTTGAQIEPRDGLSYVRGASDIALSDATVFRFLAATAEKFPSRPAAVFREQGIRWTWHEFVHQVDVLATGLHRMGVARGEAGAPAAVGGVVEQSALFVRQRRIDFVAD